MEDCVANRRQPCPRLLLAKLGALSAIAAASSSSSSLNWASKGYDFGTLWDSGDGGVSSGHGPVGDDGIFVDVVDVISS